MTFRGRPFGSTEGMSGGRGLSPADVRAAVAAQNGVCAICHKPPRRGWTTDHDHSCRYCGGKVGCRRCFRALLCDNCNAMLGQAHDDPEVLDRAAAYLRRWVARRP